MTQIPQKVVVLAGGGHAHALVLKGFASRPLRGTRLILVSDRPSASYSGMVPGFVAGTYQADELHFDLQQLAKDAGAIFHRGAINGVDVKARRLLIDGQPPLAYDVLSINVGSTPDYANVPGACDYATPAKPIQVFVDRLIQDASAQTGSGQIVVVGAGSSGVELALALRARLGPDALITLIGRSAEVLPAAAKPARILLHRELTRKNIATVLGTSVKAVERGHVVLDDERWVLFDRLIWTTNASAPSWMKTSGLAVTEAGFVKVQATLQSISHPEVFAVGDVAALEGHDLPKSGVYAVREAVPLEANLRHLIANEPLTTYHPQKNALALIGTGDGKAYYVRGWRVFKGRWVWHWKVRIDRRFMAQFRTR